MLLFFPSAVIRSCVLLTPLSVCSKLTIASFGGGPDLMVDLATLSFHVPSAPSFCADAFVATEAIANNETSAALRIMCMEPSLCYVDRSQCAGQHTPNLP